ncbi:Gfo/Idh/MocA family protein [Bradyrhizobium diazoefficiens]|uniref:Gfo/Idh/MocA family protein n=1 Tax=Bradyrhizobium diazoefficiens TaxID=1355477 RepID=UPI002714F2E3|nr:Gfo/Idh/MocA family oxidoreductase [Bradyrhizobium diazoefficiens]WLA54277.1 Gfo/Idh/MocA family oxidoreductase [Bradyrhizobium diazoefficiens]
MSGLAVALIGGGRWGRTHASVLAQLSDRVERVLWVSRHNNDALNAFLADRMEARDRFTLLESLDDALALRPDAAIVATPAADHAGTSETLLRQGVPTLVEKPLALSVEDARRLVDLAAERSVPLLVGLHLLEAPFLHHFLRLSVGRAVAVAELEWLDPEQEIRQGVVKSSNLTTHKVDEIMPHLWSMLHLVDDNVEPQLRAVKPLPQGAVEAEVGLGRSRATLRFGRRALGRKRWIRLEFRDGGSAELDFTIEPGVIVIDGVQRPDFDGNCKSSPLATELTSFLDIIRSGQDFSSSPQLASRCIGAVELAEAVRTRLIEAEAEAVAVRLAHGGSLRDPDVSTWIIDNIAPLLHIQEPRTHNERRELLELIVDAVEAANLPDNVRDDGLRPMIATIWQSDFFGHMTRGWSA